MSTRAQKKNGQMMHAAVVTARYQNGRAIIRRRGMTMFYFNLLIFIRIFDNCAASCELPSMPREFY